jgi:hypothetical protein
VPSFKDATGKQWNLSCSIGIAMKIKQRTGVDIPNAVKNFQEIVGDICNDIGKCVAIVQVILEETKQLEGPFEQLLDNMDAAAIDSAREGLVELVIDFFPQSRREAMRKLWQTSGEMGAELMAVVSGEEFQAKAKAEFRELISGKS